jgi:tagatose-6-phosphate ketose/aldose isomerase
MTYLGTETPELISTGAIHTAREIEQQPAIWEQVLRQVQAEQSALRDFLREARGEVSRILLTGAGTSAFIGLSVRGDFLRHLGVPAEAVASTDIVSHPKDYLHPAVATLVISFARSGNSPESVAALALAEQFGGKCFHLIITCNGEGALARYNSSSRKYVFVLPPQANDQSLAMTSSYSGMLLAALLIARIDNIAATASQVQKVIAYGKHILSHYVPPLRALARYDFRRAVFLGSGPLYGTALEAHLKLQELTDGRVICKNDSCLGFRHGPKAVVDKDTLVVYFFSNNHYAFQYERDLLEDMKKGTPPLLEIGIAERPFTSRLEHVFTLPPGDDPLDESFLPLCYILFGQLLGYCKSLELGLRPDIPSANGAISRVVEGVEIYMHIPTDLKMRNVL